MAIPMIVILPLPRWPTEDYKGIFWGRDNDRACHGNPEADSIVLPMQQRGNPRQIRAFPEPPIYPASASNVFLPSLNGIDAAVASPV